MELLPGAAPGLHRYQRCVLLLSLQERKRDGARTRKNSALRGQRDYQFLYALVYKTQR